MALLGLFAIPLFGGCNRITVWTPDVPDVIEIGAPEPDVVVMVHAIWRWPGYSMGQLLDEGRRRGYEVVYFRYSGLRDTLDENAARLAELLNRYDGRRVSLVVHSYGGVIVRRMFGEHDFSRLQRLVMIGTPNQGAAFADRWFRNPIYKLIFGHGGDHLTTRGIEGLPQPGCEFGILAGRGSRINPWPRGDNDGVVSVSEAYLPAAREFRVIESSHEALAQDPTAVRASFNFLETGTFGLDPRSDP